MDDNQHQPSPVIYTSINPVNILSFISQLTQDNYRDKIITLLDQQMSGEYPSIRQQLEAVKPIYESDIFDLAFIQLEDIAISIKSNTKQTVTSTHLGILCLQSKKGELFESLEDQKQRLHKLTQQNINLNQDLYSLPFCREDNTLLFASIISFKEGVDEKLKETPRNYYSLIVYENLESIH